MTIQKRVTKVLCDLLDGEIGYIQAELFINDIIQDAIDEAKAQQDSEHPILGADQ